MHMQTEKVKTFDRIESHRKAIIAGDAPVHPGQPQTTDGLSANDVVAQGDLYIRVRGSDEKIPAGYEKAARRQLVPGNEDGAQHVLSRTDGIEAWFPPNWATNLDSLVGPIVVVGDEDRAIEHKGRRGHGTVTLCAGQSYEIGYQRVWDAEARQERRARD